MSSSAPRSPAAAAYSSPGITRFCCRSSVGRFWINSRRRGKVARNGVAALAALLLLSACGPRPPRTVGIAVAGTTVDVDALVRAALQLDAASDRSADTLYAPESQVIANARTRFAHPRFAGVSYGGR